MESLAADLVAFVEAEFRDPEKNELEPPFQLVYLWEVFFELNAWRGFDRASNLPKLLSLETIYHWCVVTQRQLTSFDLATILRMETAFWDAQTPIENPATVFNDLKAIAIAEGKIRTIPMNPRKK